MDNSGAAQWIGEHLQGLPLWLVIIVLIFIGVLWIGGEFVWLSLFKGKKADLGGKKDGKK